MEKWRKGGNRERRGGERKRRREKEEQDEQFRNLGEERRSWKQEVGAKRGEQSKDKKGRSPKLR